ncbi:phenylalanine--tRNA ligase alpha subunit, cytoplasmic-like [Impatiens glandulifera]|uniref:phenylalanine--tRNA ligase alpha subunit, cytoplasmic-like n=1 Tax=Impatiens glandulifera TaxID=253017 RepID=UPI001FB0E992|nr:phenylalanine--tRNA ligase alpha subunit, cytoplasmic-like [Impatiens glandulifera]
MRIHGHSVTARKSMDNVHFIFTTFIGIILGFLVGLSFITFSPSQDIKRERWALTNEGKLYASSGSPEVQVFLAIPPEGISLEELQKKIDASVFKIGRSQVIKNQWVEMGKQLVTRKVRMLNRILMFKVQSKISDLEVIDPKDIDALKRRKLITSQYFLYYLFSLFIFLLSSLASETLA